MASLNNVVLIGNLTAAPELRSTASGRSVCNFGIAVNRPFAKEGQNEHGKRRGGARALCRPQDF